MRPPQYLLLRFLFALAGAVAGLNAVGGGAHQARFATRAQGEPSPEVQAACQAALEEADRSMDRARELILAGKGREALNFLDVAKARLDASPGAGGRNFDTVAVDAYILMHRDEDARGLLATDALSRGAWTGTILRQGLLLARNGRLKESLDLDPAHHATEFISGDGQDEVQALPNLSTQRGLVAAWCLAIAGDESVSHYRGTAELYYKMGLQAEPGQPLLALGYGFLLRSQGRPAEATRLLQYAASRVTGILKLSAETELRDIAEFQAKQKAAGK